MFIFLFLSLCEVRKTYQTENDFLTARDTFSPTGGDLADAASTIRLMAALSPSSMNITMAEIRGTLKREQFNRLLKCDD